LGLSSIVNLDQGKIGKQDIKNLIFAIFSGRKAFVYNYKERCKNYLKVLLEVPEFFNICKKNKFGSKFKKAKDRFEYDLDIFRIMKQIRLS
jgi:hypothetical protein